MATKTYIKKANWAVDAIIAGRSMGRFKTASAPKLSSESSKTRPPGQSERAIPNLVRSREDVTLSRQVSLEDDVALQDWLDARVGRAPAELIYRALDHAGNVWGKPRTFTGIFIDYEMSDTDSDAGAEDSMVTMIFALDEEAA